MKARIIKISILVLISLAIVILIASPYVARYYVVKNGKQWLGRNISLGKIHINYFTSTIRLIDFKMYEETDSSTFISFDTLLINAEPLRLLQHKLIIEQFYLKGLLVSIIQNDSSFNFDDLIAYHTSNADSTKADESEGYAFEISDIELKDGNLIFEDATLQKQISTNSIDLVIPYIAFNENVMSEGGLNFALARGGHFEADFNLQPVTGNYNASVSISQLYLDPFYEFLTRYLNIGSINGYINGTLKLSGNINDAARSLASGNLSLHDFEITNPEQQKILGTGSLDIVMLESDVYNNQFRFDSVRMDQPYCLLEMRDSTFNFSTLVISDSTAEQHEELITPVDSLNRNAEVFYSLNSFIIKNGTLSFVDHRADEPFTYHLSALEMNVDSLTSNSEYLQLYARMLLNERGTLKAELGFNPKNPMDMSLNYVITDFQLSDLNIYSRYYMGFPILYGDMYYKANTTIAGGQLNSENNLIIQNVEVGNKRGGLYDLPVKFALFLLKDKDGVIKLDVPVRGDLKDPKIKVGKIIWNTFRNLIIKTAAAPGKFLANLLNVDPGDIESVSFDYADTVLTDNHKHQVELLLELERRKPGLEIEMFYFNDRSLEKEAIAVSLVKDEYLNGGGNASSEKAFEKYVREKSTGDSVSINKACLALANKIQVDSIAMVYEQIRINNLKQLLKSKSDSTRIVVSAGPLKSPKNDASLPVFEVKYSLQDSILTADVRKE